jgi:hypothetical protein
MSERVRDSKPYIDVKDVIVARSGIYMYTREEVLKRGLKPKVDKPWYKEMRPAAAIVAAKDLFELVPVPAREHVPGEIDKDNFDSLASGVVGGPISVVPLGEEIGLQGRIAFFTQGAYDYYNEGNKETSADYTSVTELVDNPEEVGYDIILKEITSVNNVAITAKGRGGPSVRILDSAPVDALEKLLGRKSMGILQTLGILKPKETFSTVVQTALVESRSLDSAGVAAKVQSVVEQVASFPDSPEKTYIVSSVKDSFLHPDEVLKPDTWKKVSGIIDGLHARCMDAAAVEAKKVIDSADEDEDDENKKKKEKDCSGAPVKDSGEKPGDDKEKEGRSQDTAALINAAVAAATKSVKDELMGSLPGAIDAGVKKALNITEPEGGTRVTDSALGFEEENSDWMTDGIFGGRN